MGIKKFCATFCLLFIPIFAWGQLKCDSPNALGVASLAHVRGNDKSYLAVWRHSDTEEVLDIYSGLQCAETNRVAHFVNTGTPWQSLSALEDFAVMGFRVRTIAGDDWFGGTQLFMYDGKHFRKAFDSGETAEIFDLDGDGYPEVLEFLGGKGRPAGKVRIWIWKQDQFKQLTTVAASELFSAKLLSLLSSASKSVSKRGNP